MEEISLLNIPRIVHDDYIVYQLSMCGVEVNRSSFTRTSIDEKYENRCCLAFPRRNCKLPPYLQIYETRVTVQLSKPKRDFEAPQRKPKGDFQAPQRKYDKFGIQDYLLGEVFIITRNHIISNYYKLELKIYGHVFADCIRAFHWRKATDLGYNDIAKDFSRTKKPVGPLTRMIGQKESKTWEDKNAEAVMKELLETKAQCCQPFVNVLLQTGQCIIADATKNHFWSIGIDEKEVWSYPVPLKWSGKNLLGEMLMDLREKLRNQPKNIPETRLSDKVESEGNHEYEESVNSVNRGRDLIKAPVKGQGAVAILESPKQQHPQQSFSGSRRSPHEPVQGWTYYNQKHKGNGFCADKPCPYKTPKREKTKESEPVQSRKTDGTTERQSSKYPKKDREVVAEKCEPVKSSVPDGTSEKQSLKHLNDKEVEENRSRKMDTEESEPVVSSEPDVTTEKRQSLKHPKKEEEVDETSAADRKTVQSPRQGSRTKHQKPRKGRGTHGKDNVSYSEHISDSDKSEMQNSDPNKPKSNPNQSVNTGESLDNGIVTNHGTDIYETVKGENKQSGNKGANMPNYQTSEGHIQNRRKRFESRPPETTSEDENKNVQKTPPKASVTRKEESQSRQRKDGGDNVTEQDDGKGRSQGRPAERRNTSGKQRFVKEDIDYESKKSSQADRGLGRVNDRGNTSGKQGFMKRGNDYQSQESSQANRWQGRPAERRNRSEKHGFVKEDNDDYHSKEFSQANRGQGRPAQRRNTSGRQGFVNEDNDHQSKESSQANRGQGRVNERRNKSGKQGFVKEDKDYQSRESFQADRGQGRVDDRRNTSGHQGFVKEGNDHQSIEFSQANREQGRLDDRRSKSGNQWYANISRGRTSNQHGPKVKTKKLEDGSVTESSVYSNASDYSEDNHSGTAQYERLCTPQDKPETQRQHSNTIQQSSGQDKTEPQQKPDLERIVLRNIPQQVQNPKLKEFLQSHGVTLSGIMKMQQSAKEMQKGTYSEFTERACFGVKPFPPLPTTAKIEGYDINIYHDSQRVCFVCNRPGHRQGNIDCPAYRSCDNENVIAFQGQNDELSNFYPCQLKIYGRLFKSSEHAYQWKKARELGYDSLADKIFYSKHAGEAKRLAKEIVIEKSNDWERRRVDVMREILKQKAKDCVPFRTTLKMSGQKTFAEATNDKFWATGLFKNDTLRTNPKWWPGRNTLGSLHDALRSQILTGELDKESESDVKTEDEVYGYSPDLDEESSEQENWYHRTDNLKDSIYGKGGKAWGGGSVTKQLPSDSVAQAEYIPPCDDVSAESWPGLGTKKQLPSDSVAQTKDLPLSDDVGAESWPTSHDEDIHCPEDTLDPSKCHQDLPLSDMVSTEEDIAGSEVTKPDESGQSVHGT